MPYLVIHGSVRSAGTVYEKGDILPDGVVDDALVASGVIGDATHYRRSEAAKKAAPQRLDTQRENEAKRKAVKS